MSYLSKSDFKVAQDCPAKLYYKKECYPSVSDENEFLKMLAEGGHVIGKYAMLLFPDGKEVKTDDGTRYALEETRTYLQNNEEITLFEAAVESEGKIIRIDILQKKGNQLDLIEVKSKSWKSFDKKDDQLLKMKEYVEDVAFQAWVLEEAYPEMDVTPYLYMPDKSRDTALEGLPGWFRVIKEAPEPGSTFTKVEVEFLHEPGSPEHQQLIADNFMELVDVTQEVNNMMANIRQKGVAYLDSLQGESIRKIEGTLSKSCFKCEYKTGGNGDKNGFVECWGELANVQPSMAELFRVGSIGANKYADDQIKSGKVGLYDIEETALNKKDGTLGIWGQRQLIQLQHTRSQTEWISPEMKGELADWHYPLYFIDFETSTNAIPFHAKMSPYEVVAFQWSCHVIRSENAQPEHYEWINTAPAFPNFKFAEALMELVPDNATMLMWASHENTVLRHIYRQMDKRRYKNDVLKAWLESVVKMDKKDTGRFIDMDKFTLKHYFHPYMKGQTSIKTVLPAVWNHNSWLQEIPWLQEYVMFEDGELQSPYEALAKLLGADEQGELVNEGSGAMRAYFEILFGTGADDARTLEKWKKALLQYCQLDTMAMVIIWKYWRNQAAL